MLVTSTIMPLFVDIKLGVGASVVAGLNLVQNILAAIARKAADSIISCIVVLRSSFNNMKYSDQAL